MTHDELISRIEGLTGPSSAVDKEILAHFGFTWRGMDYWHADNKRTWGQSSFLTESIDSAVAFANRMLPGWSWECRASGTGDKGQATVWNPLKAPGHNDEQRAYNCPSPAIALVLATLKALEASNAE